MLSRELPCQAWLCGREAYGASRELGEIVVSDINIWTAPGSLASGARSIGRLPSGTQVSVLEEIEGAEGSYFRVAARDVKGWVYETFLSWNWSSFTFIGTVEPRNACNQLEFSAVHGGYAIAIRQGRVAVTTDGDPANFDVIQIAVARYLDKLTAAQALHTSTPLRIELTEWVEVPLILEKTHRTVGFMVQEEDSTQQPVQAAAFELANSYTSLLSSFPYLDLAVQDWHQALRYPVHALIFLARALESIEYHFSGFAAKQKGIGKEKAMQEILGVSRADVKYVTQRANDSHRRHASRDGTLERLPSDESDRCYEITQRIILAFIQYLRQTTGL